MIFEQTPRSTQAEAEAEAAVAEVDAEANVAALRRCVRKHFCFQTED